MQASTITKISQIAEAAGNRLGNSEPFRIITRLTEELGKLAVLLACCAGATLGATESASWNYRGFNVSGAGVAPAEPLRTAVAEQIDIVLSVGFDQETVRFLRSVPFVVVPAGDVPSGTPGLYVRGDRVVKLTSRIVAVGHKPVLLHELLHAYHDQKVEDGFRNSRILGLYREARTNAIFDLKSHMMQTPAEYLACAGTTFLFGVTAQEPFRRTALEKQPELLALLQALFGPTSGSYEGSLSSSEPGPVAQPVPANRP